MRNFAALLCALLACLTAASAQIAPPSKRIALVVGNGAYQVETWRLPNPANDATLIANRLRALQFDVDLVADADRGKFEQALSRFGRKLRAGGNETVAVFYYAGHGAQIEELNYLVPTDALAYSLDDLIEQSPAMQRLFDDMRDAGNRVNIIILDACRNIPPLPARAGERARRPGFATQIPNVLIAYSTLAGTEAPDDGAGVNSAFTATLADALAAHANEPVQTLFSDLLPDVRARSRGLQSASFLYGLERVKGFKLSPDGQAAVMAVLPTRASVAQQTTTDPLRRPTRSIGGFRDCPSCPEMIRIPAGEVDVGTPGATNNEVPVRHARIRSFAASRFEVTRGEWGAFVTATHRGDPPNDCQVLIGKAWTGVGSWRHPYIDQEDNHPAVCVNWNDAQDYVAWLSRTTGKRYRLLSETEWEYAARAGARGRYPWGETISPDNANYGASNVAGTLPVGSYAPNAFGLFDIDGNAGEWVQDFLSDRATVGEGRAVDPCPPPNVSECYSNTRMNRGGSWEGDADVMRIAFRNGNLATVRYAALGMRVARELD